MFEGCNTLKTINGNLELEGDYIYDISKIFSECSSLQSLSNFLIGNLNKVIALQMLLDLIWILLSYF